MNVNQKIEVLYRRLAGDKLSKVEATKVKLVGEGKKLQRAMADALEIHKCLPKSED